MLDLNIKYTAQNQDKIVPKKKQIIYFYQINYDKQIIYLNQTNICLTVYQIKDKICWIQINIFFGGRFESEIKTKRK